jgi:preprotein translocase subunit YajC
MDPLLIFMMLAVGAMFLLTSRTRKQQRKAVEFRQTLAVGDEVMTGSGLFGTVVDVDGDVITLESPSGARTDWLRAAIAKHATPPWAEDVEGEEEDELAPQDESELLADGLDDDTERRIVEVDRPADDVAGERALHADDAADRADGAPEDHRRP